MIYSGNTVYYRIVSPDSRLPLLQSDYNLESFTVIGYLTYDKKDYAAVLYKVASGFRKVDRIGYIPAEDFINGDIYTSAGQAQLAIQSKLEAVCKIPVEVDR